MDVSVILVNYNTIELTSKTIDSIISFSDGFEFEIILIDNNSSDGSKEHFTMDSRITYIYLDKNIGFGRANNLGAKYATGDYLFILNTDTVLLNNAINSFIKFFKENNKSLNIGVLGCVLYSQSGEEILSHVPFKSIQQFLKFFKQKVLEKLFQKSPSLVTVNISKPVFEVEAVLGADMFISKRLFEQVGGFDPIFFLYGEETELQKRICDLGYRNFLIRESKIIHLEGGSGGKKDQKLNPFTIMQLKKGDMIYINKHYSLLYYKIYVAIQLITWYPFILFDSRFNKENKKESLQILLNFKKKL